MQPQPLRSQAGRGPQISAVIWPFPKQTLRFELVSGQKQFTAAKAQLEYCRADTAQALSFLLPAN